MSDAIDFPSLGGSEGPPELTDSDRKHFQEKYNPRPWTDEELLLEKMRLKAEEKSRSRFKGLVTSKELLEREFEPLRWVIPGLIPEGLTILSGPPKTGKSWLCLNLAAALSVAGHALGKIEVEETGVLYLSLEDTPRRLQDRLRKINADPSEKLFFLTGWDSGLSGLDVFLREHPIVKVVIIDTIFKFISVADSSDYSETVTAISGLKLIADTMAVSIIGVHHTRKMAALDFIDSILGSRGITGTADTLLVLSKDRFQHEAKLSVTSRETGEAELALRFDTDVFTWLLLGDSFTRQKTEQRQELFDLLKTAPEAMSPVQVYRSLRDRGDKRSPSTIKRILWEMAKDGVLMSLSGFYTCVNREPHEPKEAPVHAVHEVHGVDTVHVVHEKEEEIYHEV